MKYINLIYENSDIKIIKIPYLLRLFFNILYCISFYVILFYGIVIKY